MKTKKIRYTSCFKAHYKERVKGNKILEKLLQENVDIFLEDRNNLGIADHALQRDLRGYRAFSIDSDLRVIYKETENYFLFLDIGTHKEVYG